MAYVTRLASLGDYQKGGVEVIDDDPKNYTFSNIFEVASHAKPFEQIAVAKNFEYVLEAVRVEGTSGWRACSHDQSALVLDGEVEFTLRTLGEGQSLPSSGSAGVPEEAAQALMGRVVARRGHLTLLPAGRAYRSASTGPAVVLIQTAEGVDTQFRWAEICQTGGVVDSRGLPVCPGTPGSISHCATPESRNRIQNGSDWHNGALLESHQPPPGMDVWPFPSLPADGCPAVTAHWRWWSQPRQSSPPATCPTSWPESSRPGAARFPWSQGNSPAWRPR